MNEAVLRDALLKHCDVSDVIIKKGNAHGNFDKFCYGFATLNRPEKEAHDAIARISEDNPSWRIKIKDESHESHPPSRQERYSKPSYPAPQNYPPPQSMYPPMQHQMPPQMMPMHHLPPQHNQQHNQQQHGHSRSQGQYNRSNYNSSNYQQQQVVNDKGQIFGEKRHRIMVRELWLGGIPEMIDHNGMTAVMSQFGYVEATEIFPKFAFVKYKRAADAAVAFERASIIFERFGQNSGFRIAFSDPSRRKQIVANNYQEQKNAVMIPVLFLGFPPITSANVEINHMMNICEKYGPIVNYYMKKSTNAQMRSYILFTYDSLKSALKAKQELCRRKDLLGEKRVEITLLLDDESVTKGRDFSYTEANFTNQHGPERVKKPAPRHHQQQQQQPPQYQEPGNYQPNYPPLVPGNYPNMMMPNPNPYYPPQPQYAQPGNYPPMNNPYYYHPPQNAYEQSTHKMPPPQKILDKQSNDVYDIINSVYSDAVEEKKKVPQKTQNDKEANTSEILSKFLGKSVDSRKEEQEDEGEIHEPEQSRDKEPDWSGFMTWRGGKRAGVDGYALEGADFSDYSINVTSVIENSDVVFKDKANMMVFQPTNSISEPVFNDYLKVFKKRTGVSMTKNWVIYIIGKNSVSESVAPIKDNELLVVMEKAALSQQIKDKATPCNDSYFE